MVHAQPDDEPPERNARVTVGVVAAFLFFATCAALVTRDCMVGTGLPKRPEENKTDVAR